MAHRRWPQLSGAFPRTLRSNRPALGVCRGGRLGGIRALRELPVHPRGVCRLSRPPRRRRSAGLGGSQSRADVADGRHLRLAVGATRPRAKRGPRSPRRRQWCPRRPGSTEGPPPLVAGAAAALYSRAVGAATRGHGGVGARRVLLARPARAARAGGIAHDHAGGLCRCGRARHLADDR